MNDPATQDITFDAPVRFVIDFSEEGGNLMHEDHPAGARLSDLLAAERDALRDCGAYDDRTTELSWDVTALPAAADPLDDEASPLWSGSVKLELPPAPECPVEGGECQWEETQAWGSGHGGVCCDEQCRLCGLRQRTDTGASDHHGQCVTEVTYAAPDEDRFGPASEIVITEDDALEWWSEQQSWTPAERDEDDRLLLEDDRIDQGLERGEHGEPVQLTVALAEALDSEGRARFEEDGDRLRRPGEWSAKGRRSPMDLTAELAAHRSWMETDGREGERLDAACADLQPGLGLAGADLTRANLSGADLRDRNLAGTRLRRADLRYAEADRARLPFADLPDARPDAAVRRQR